MTKKKRPETTEEMLKLCGNCGRALNSWWRFCPMCGETAERAKVMTVKVEEMKG